MSDLISRQAALYAIYGICNEPVAWLIRAASEIEKLPPAQPEIIRCKDCLMHGACRFEQGLGLNGYCSQAERIKDD